MTLKRERSSTEREAGIFEVMELNMCCQKVIIFRGYYLPHIKDWISFKE